MRGEEETRGDVSGKVAARWNLLRREWVRLVPVQASGRVTWNAFGGDWTWVIGENPLCVFLFASKNGKLSVNVGTRRSLWSESFEMYRGPEVVSLSRIGRNDRTVSVFEGRAEAVWSLESRRESNRIIRIRTKQYAPKTPKSSMLVRREQCKTRTGASVTVNTTDNLLFAWRSAG